MFYIRMSFCLQLVRKVDFNVLIPAIIARDRVDRVQLALDTGN